MKRPGSLSPIVENIITEKLDITSETEAMAAAEVFQLVDKSLNPGISQLEFIQLFLLYVQWCCDRELDDLDVKFRDGLIVGATMANTWATMELRSAINWLKKAEKAQFGDLIASERPIIRLVE